MRAIRVGAACVAWLSLTAAAIAADEPGTGALRWDILPGRLETFTITIDRKLGSSPNVIRQTGKLTRMFFASHESRRSTCAQMLELGAGQIVGVDDRRVAGSRPTSEPASAEVRRLASARTQFWVRSVTPAEAPLLAPGGTPFEKDLMRGLLEWGEWPAIQRGRGWRWTSAITSSVVSGERKFEFAELPPEPRREPQAELTFKGALAAGGSLAGAYRITDAGGAMQWGLRSNRLVAAQVRATYEPARTGAAGRVEISLTVKPQSRTAVSNEEHNRLQSQVLQLTAVVGAYDADRFAEAESLAQAFLKAWPMSVWEPLARFVLEQAGAERRAVSPVTSLPAESLAKTVADLFDRWQTASTQEQTASVEELRVALQRLVQASGNELRRMTEAEEASQRAAAALAYAFGTAPAEAAILVRAAGDADPAVRASAFTAMAIRVLPLVSAEVFERGFGDPVAGVRVRACQAAAACVTVDSPEAARVADALTELLADDTAAVRSAAAAALGRIGTARHAAAIEAAIDRPENKAIRGGLREALHELRARRRS